MYRWLPFGTITKNGRSLVVDEKFAAALKLPHFRPPIKLGSHDELTPAGGHILAFETRADGIYVMPEYNPAGEKALSEGHYRYHSAEIITRGAMELPDGTRLEAPIILGDAFLHTPHLGEQAALYTAEVIKELDHMSDDVTIPVPLLKQLFSFLNRAPEPPAAPAPVEPSAPGADESAAKLAAAEAKVAELSAQLTAREAAEALAARVAQFTSQLTEAKVDTALAVVLAALPNETTAPIMVAFKALAEQIKVSNLTAPVGSQTPPGTQGDPKLALHTAILSKMAELKSTDYNAALDVVQAEQPELFAAGFGAKKE